MKLKDILLEEIPYVSSDKIRQGLVRKHGSQELDSYTFGIELEFIPELSYKVDEDRLLSLLTHDIQFQSWADQHIQDERENLNRRWRGDVDSWDETFGPVDPDTWEAHNGEPQREDFDDDDSYSDAHDEWADKLKDVKWNYKYFSPSDFYEQVAQNLIRDDGWEEYVNREEVAKKDVDSGCNDAVRFIKGEMGQKVVFGDETTPDTWAVSPDGDNVEIRSKHLNQSEFGLVEDICSFVSNRNTSGGTSAHVHIGLPKDFDAFDLLAMSNLADEPSIKDSVGPERELSAYSRLRDSLHKTIITRILQEPKDQKTGEVPKEFVIKNDVIKHMMRSINRYHGTNIASIDIGTVEFRYFSSDIASESRRFIGWIKYFLILPKIAKTKNKVVLKGDRKLTCVREPGQIRFFLDKDTVKVSDLPSTDIKAAAEPETSSPPTETDPRIEKLRRLKDKLKSARKNIRT